MYIDMNGYKLLFGEKMILEQGPEGDSEWGHYQFPGLTRRTDGSIVACWSYGPDDISYRVDKNPNGARHSVSSDDGKTWTHGGNYFGCSTKNKMKNGRYFIGFNGKGAYKADYLDKYSPALAWNDFKMFFADDIACDTDKLITASEYDPLTGTTSVFDVKVNWPYMPLVQYPNELVYPTTQIFCLSNRPVITFEDDLYLPLYFYGFDSFAPSREESIKEYCNKYSVFLFRSRDNGRTWDLLSQLMTDENIKNADEGLCEPCMTVMPDGSFVMLMRTGFNNPSYIARSTDKGVTWSKPRVFDSIGVLPQLLTLNCGVTLASYGRPTLRFNSTIDPHGIVWGDSFEIPISGGKWQSCFYTDLLPLNDNTALFIYSDFKYPNKNGEGVKTIIARTVTVELP